MPWDRKHLLGIADLEQSDIALILDTAESFKEILRRPIKKVPVLRGKTIANLFYEPSTRTRLSFELAEKRLSADTLSVSVATSSVSKGESLQDTGRNIEAMNVDTVVLRHRSSGAPHLLSRYVSMGVVNAGDGAHEHPTQALLDMLTVREKVGRLEGLKITIVGDILHSRVARSNILGFIKSGGSVTVCGPRTLIPPGVEQLGVSVSYRLKEAIADCDVINVLRIQRERQTQCLFPSLREYAINYCLTREKLKHARPDVLVMHPGPINRGVEMAPDVADGPNAVILEQVTNGVAVRMAVLYLLSGGELPREASS